MTSPENKAGAASLSDVCEHSRAQILCRRVTAIYALIETCKLNHVGTLRMLPGALSLTIDKTSNIVFVPRLKPFVADKALAGMRMSALKRFRSRTFAASADQFEAGISGLERRLEALRETIDGVGCERRLEALRNNVDALIGQMNGLERRIERSEAGIIAGLRDVHARLGLFFEEAVQVGTARAMTATLMGQAPTQGEIREALRFIQPMGVEGRRKIRIGSAFDGGYVMIDDFTDVDMAFSLGIETNDDWDMEMVRRSIAVKQFDFSIDQAPNQHELLQFQPLKVAASSGDGTISLQDMADGFSADSKCILKADIEGSEWEVFDSTPTEILACFSQIVCEFHLLQRLSERDFFDMASGVFRKLNATHQSIHVHGNNSCPIANASNLTIPTLLEVTFARRSDYDFCATDEIFPIDLDAPNIPGKPDIFLGAMRF